MILASNLSKPEMYSAMLSEESAENSINLIDLYAKDEILENDNDIPFLINRSQELSVGNSAFTLVAKLNKFLYELSIEDLISAESTLLDIKSYSREGLSPSLLFVVDYQVEHMFMIMMHLLNN